MTNKKNSSNGKTAYEIFKEAEQQYLEYTPLRPSNQQLEITNNNIKPIIQLINNLQYSLFWGYGDAAYYLAKFHYNGWIFEKNAYHGDFIILIGKKLASTKCLDEHFKSDTALSPMLEQIAAECNLSISETQNLYKGEINEAMKTITANNINNKFKNLGIKNIFELPDLKSIPFFTSLVDHTETYNLPNETTPLMGSDNNKDSFFNEKCPFCLIL